MTLNHITVLATALAMALELVWDYIERKDKGRVNHWRGFTIRCIIGALIVAYGTTHYLIYLSAYIAFFNPLINLVWYFGGWMPKTPNWLTALFYIGRTSFVDQLWWHIFKGWTKIVALPLSLFIGAILSSIHFWPELWQGLFEEIFK